MCLYSNPVSEQKLNNRNPNSKIVVWKCLTLNKKSLGAPIYDKIYRRGWNYALRKNKIYRHNTFGYYKVSYGFGLHVGRNKRWMVRNFGPSLENPKEGNCVLVKCEILVKDIVAANENEFVVNSLYISPDEYNKFFKKGK